jgi:hypothetical protein
VDNDSTLGEARLHGADQAIDRWLVIHRSPPSR